jgi:hypothetical protein
LDNLILTIIAAGLLGGIVFLLGTVWALAAHCVRRLDAWAEARAIVKSDMTILIDRIHRGWWNMLPTLRVKSNKMNGGTWRLVDRSTAPQWDKMQEPDK